MWTNIFKGTVLCKQGPLQKFVRAYLFNGTYSNLRRDRAPTSVVLELPELIEVVRIYLDAQVRKKRIRSVTHTRRLLRAWIFFFKNLLKSSRGQISSLTGAIV